MVVQRDLRWLESATPEEIVAAQSAGELAHLLGADTPEQIAAGRLASLLGAEIKDPNGDAASTVAATGRVLDRLAKARAAGR